MPDWVWERVREAKGMPPPGSRVIIGVSGGQDSCALLHVLQALRDEFRLELLAAHVHHGMRGDSADEDEGFVSALCTRLGVPLALRHADVPGSARRMHRSEEETGRTARHGFFQDLAADDPRSRIALGHTRDDRAETVLLNILRGTGVDGLAAMKPAAGKVLRPLLSLSRADTAAYCERHGLAYRHDATNDSPHYRRNRLRSDLIPLLERDYNPQVRDALLRLAELAEDDSAALDRAAGSLIAPTGESMLAGAHPALARRAIREMIRRARGSVEDVPFSLVEDALEALATPSSCGSDWSRTLPPGALRLTVRGSVTRVEPVPVPVAARRIAVALPAPGAVRISELGVRVECAQTANAADAPGTSDGTCVILDADAVQPPLAVRNRRPGDRIRATGAPGTRKLQDILVDHRVPRAERDRVPILADRDGIVWVVGHAIAERAAWAPGRPGLLIRCLREAPEE